LASNMQARYKPLLARRLRRPLYLSRVPAGTFSPADDYREKSLDLNEYLVKHEAATFFVRISGDSMKGAGILSGDLAVVDRSLKPANGSVVVACLNGETTCKRLRLVKNRVVLASENPDYPAVEVNPASGDFEVWGVVTHVIHKVVRA
jgi:DNA polymerase V